MAGTEGSDIYTRIGELRDVKDVAATDGDSMIWDASEGSWGPAAIADATVVADAITALNLGDIVTHDAAEFHPAVVADAHIPNPAGGATVDAESRAAINLILTALEGAGIVAAV